MSVASTLILALSYLLAWVVIGALSPLLVAVHEAGHAVFALVALIRGRIVVEVGQGERVWRIRKGRLGVEFYLQSRRSGIYGRWPVLGWKRFKPTGCVRHAQTPPPLLMIPMVLGGPAASLALAALWLIPTATLWHILAHLLWAYARGRDIVWALRYFTLLPWFAICVEATLVSAFLGFANLWPRRRSPTSRWRRGALGTDGWMALHYLREARRRDTKARRFDRFTPRMRRVFTYARHEALARGHSAITPLHLLLGVLREPDATAVRVVQALNADITRLRTHADDALAEVEPTASPPSLAAETKVVIERMVDVARRRGDTIVGTEHALLALLAVEDGGAAHVLTRNGITLDAARTAVAAHSAGAQEQDSA